MSRRSFSKALKLRAATLIIRWYPVLAAIVILAFRLVDPLGLSSASDRMVEIHLHLWRGVEYSKKVAVVPVTPTCVTHFNEWPLHLDKYAQVVDVLTKAGAKVIALQLPANANDSASQRQAFEKAIHASGRVVLGNYLQLGKGAPVKSDSKPKPGDPPAGFDNLNLLNINDEAYIRLAPLAVRMGDKEQLSLAVQAARLLAPTLDRAAWPTRTAQSGDTDPKAAPASVEYANINYMGAADLGSLPRVAFSQVFMGLVTPTAVADRIVFVGGQGNAAKDGRQSPFGPISDLEIHANIAQNVVENAFLSPVGAAALAVLLLVLALALGELFSALSISAAVACAAGLILACSAGCLYSFSYGHILLSPLPFIGLTLIVAAFQPLRLSMARWAVCRGAGWLETRLGAFKAGTQYFEKGKYHEAIAQFEVVRDRLPGASPQSDYYLTVSCLRAGKDEAARRCFGEMDLMRYDLEWLKRLGQEFDRAEILSISTQLFEYVYLQDNNYPGVARLWRDARLRLEEREKAEGFTAMTQEVKGRYTDLEFLGKGGMSLVWKAYDPTTKRTVALKTLSPLYAQDARVVTRFRREVQAMQSLDHENIARVFGIETGNVMFFTMEFLVGDDLRVVLEKQGRLPIPRSIAIARQIGRALQHAHARGVIHRDIKPENVILLPGDVVKLLDFGVAKLEYMESITRTGAAIGSPWYMSPEQHLGAGVDARADIFSLGVVLYECLTGRLPYPTSGQLGMDVEPYDPTRYVQLDPKLVDLLLQCIARKPTGRPATATAVLERLDAFVSS